jgi:hypothetical protein
MAKGIVCKEKAKKMNWVAYVEWTNGKQCRHKFIASQDAISLLSDDEGGNSDDDLLHENIESQANQGGGEFLS